MYTRVAELTSKSGKARDLCNTIDDKILPILKRQDGYVDETVLVADTEPNRVLGLSFWNTRPSAPWRGRGPPQIRRTTNLWAITFASAQRRSLSSGVWTANLEIFF